MPELPWTKYQDFYLRLGFLKLLVAVLSPERRSAANTGIHRSLQSPALAPGKNHPGLFAEALARLGEAASSPEAAEMTVADALLITGDCPSWLTAITHKTAYKVLDWGHDVRFVGAGNQIMERGLLLRHLLPEDAVHRFLAGDPTAWNPFNLDIPDRLFFLYHLCEIDRVTARVVLHLAEQQPGRVLESLEAARLTCRALFEVLDGARGSVIPRDLPAFRTARELACTIARELGLEDLLKGCGRTTPRVPQARVPSTRAAGSPPRQTTKNADHQTIPRFEQLADLGFVTKPDAPDRVASSYKTLPRRRWRYQPNESCRAWAHALGGVLDSHPRWLWHRFGRAAVEAGLSGVEGKTNGLDASSTVTFLSDAYRRAHRPIGHTPFESVALLAMILAASRGYVLEMATLHAGLLALKKHNRLPDHVFFASGNDLDRMFVLFKPGYEERLLDVYDDLFVSSEP